MKISPKKNTSISGLLQLWNPCIPYLPLGMFQKSWSLTTTEETKTFSQESDFLKQTSPPFKGRHSHPQDLGVLQVPTNGVIHPTRTQPTQPTRVLEICQGSLPTIFCPHISGWNLWSWTHQTWLWWLELSRPTGPRSTGVGWWKDWFLWKISPEKRMEKSGFWSKSLVLLTVFGAAKSLHSGSLMFIS